MLNFCAFIVGGIIWNEVVYFISETNCWISIKLGIVVYTKLCKVNLIPIHTHSSSNLTKRVVLNLTHEGTAYKL